MYDDLSKPDVIEQHLAVNMFGPLNVTRAFLPLLKRVKGSRSEQPFNVGACAPADHTRLFHFKGGHAQYDPVVKGALSRPAGDRPRHPHRTCRYRYDPERRFPEGFPRVRGRRPLRWPRKRPRGPLPG